MYTHTHTHALTQNYRRTLGERRGTQITQQAFGVVNRFRYLLVLNDEAKFLQNCRICVLYDV